MSRLKKLSLASLALASLFIGTAMLVNRAGRTGRLTPAAVPTVPDPFRAGRDALDAGDYPVALAYFLQVPNADPAYNRAQRYIGWELYGDRLGRPVSGLNYVHRALLDEPFSSRSWQDASRTYVALFSRRSRRHPVAPPAGLAPAPAPAPPSVASPLGK